MRLRWFCRVRRRRPLTLGRPGTSKNALRPISVIFQVSSAVRCQTVYPIDVQSRKPAFFVADSSSRGGNSMRAVYFDHNSWRTGFADRFGKNRPGYHPAT